MTLDLVRLLLFPLLMAAAAVSDLLTMRIPNRISLLLIAGFALLAVFGGLTVHAVSMHITAGLAVLMIAFACFALGWLGGGDAKLLAASALWLGFDHLLAYLTYATVAGGVLALLLLQFRRWPLPVGLLSHDWVQRLHDKKTGIPYGVALGIGALLVYPETIWMKAVEFGRFVG